MAYFELRGVSKGYGRDDRRTEVLKDIQLEIERGEFLAIVGFSGTGKTTLLSLMAGLLAPDSGEILLDGVPVTEPGPDRGVVFQNYSLLPWLSVFGNIELAVKHVFPGISREERAERVRRYIELVNLTPATHKRPAQLSGGMRQRVSVARGLAMEPKVLLLDEPLGALDALTRGTLQSEIERIWSVDRKTVVMITNDVDEAILLADRIIPLRPGEVATLGPSFAVPLRRPRDRAALNHDPSFKKIRNEISQYLISVSAQRTQASSVEPTLPNLVPKDFLPASRSEAAFGGME